MNKDKSEVIRIEDLKVINIQIKKIQSTLAQLYIDQF